MKVLLLFALFKGEETEVQGGLVTVSRAHCCMRQKRNSWPADTYAPFTDCLRGSRCGEESTPYTVLEPIFKHHDYSTKKAHEMPSDLNNVIADIVETFDCLK